MKRERALRRGIEIISCYEGSACETCRRHRGFCGNNHRLHSPDGRPTEARLSYTMQSAAIVAAGACCAGVVSANNATNAVAEAHRCWRGKRSEPVRLGVRDHHTRSVCAQSPAQSEQWCCWCCYRWSIFGSAEIAAIRALQRCRSMANFGT
jgi:hypothetical protein